MRVKPGSRIFTHWDLQLSSKDPNSLHKLANNDIKMHAILFPINQLQVDIRSATCLVQAWCILPWKTRIKQQITCEDVTAYSLGEYRRGDHISHDSLILIMASNDWLVTNHWNVPPIMNSLHFSTFGALKSIWCHLASDFPFPTSLCYPLPFGCSLGHCNDYAQASSFLTLGKFTQLICFT